MKGGRLFSSRSRGGGGSGGGGGGGAGDGGGGRVEDVNYDSTEL